MQCTDINDCLKQIQDYYTGEKTGYFLLVNTEKGSHLFGQLPICKERRSIEEAVAGNPRLSGPLPRTAERSAFFAAYALLPFEEVRKRFLRLPPVHYRVAAKVLTPAMKEKIRKIIK